MHSHAAACSSPRSPLGALAAARPRPGDAKKDLVIGGTAGPNADQLKLGIVPILEKKGYKVKLVEFNDYVQPNFALAQGSLDANLFQHLVYLNKFAADQKLALVELVQGARPRRSALQPQAQDLAEVKEGTASRCRTTRATRRARWCCWSRTAGSRCATGIDPIRASEKDIAENPRSSSSFRSKPRSCRARWDDTDYAFVNGNFAISSGLKLTEALALEKTSPTT